MNKSNQAFKLLLSLACLPIYLASSLIPKSKKIWIFSAWQGKSFSDNSKHLYLYVKDNNKEINPIWITKSKNLAMTLNTRGINAFYYKSAEGIYYQLRAGAAFFTHHQNEEFLSFLLSRKTALFQLWHGTPLKKIQLDIPDYQKPSRRIKKKILNIIFPWRRDKWDFVVSPSSAVSAHLSTAFAGNRIVITGYPRNDKIRIGTINSDPIRIHKVIYMPTFRGVNLSRESNDSMNKLLRSSGFEVKTLDQFFSSRNATLTLRLHPSNTLDKEFIGEISKCTHIKISTSDEDIYDLIDQYDALITDYSSIFFDFMLSGKPVIHAGFDLDTYLLDSRALYQSYDSVCLTPEIDNWTDIMKFIDQMSFTGLPSEYIEHYKLICNKHNYFRDNMSSARVAFSAMQALR